MYNQHNENPCIWSETAYFTDDIDTFRERSYCLLQQNLLGLGINAALAPKEWTQLSPEDEMISKLIQEGLSWKAIGARVGSEPDPLRHRWNRARQKNPSLPQVKACRRKGPNDKIK